MFEYELEILTLNGVQIEFISAWLYRSQRDASIAVIFDQNSTYTTLASLQFEDQPIRGRAGARSGEGFSFKCVVQEVDGNSATILMSGAMLIEHEAL